MSTPLPSPAPLPIGRTLTDRLDIGITALFDRDQRLLDEARRDEFASRPFDAEREYATERYR